MAGSKDLRYNVAVDAYLIYRNGALVKSTRSTTVTDVGLSPASSFAVTASGVSFLKAAFCWGDAGASMRV